MTEIDFHMHAEESRARGDAIRPGSAMSCYSIAACEVWALAMDRIAQGHCEPWELFLAFRRQKQLTVLYGVDP